MSRVVHFEIQASDPEKLVAFYTELFGWAFHQWGGPKEYWLIETGPADERGINGGLVRRPGPPPTDPSANSFVCIVDVASAETSFALAVSLGATAAMPVIPVPGVGWLCYVKDPDNNTLGMMQADDHAG